MRISGRLLVLAAISVALLSSGTAMALAPFGPPRATIGAGRWAIGADYARQTMDLQSSGTYREGYPADGSYLSYCKYDQFDLKEVKSDLVFGKIGYGLGDTWDLFARIGVSNAKGDLLVSSPGTDGPLSTDFFNGGERFSLSNGLGVAWGLGSRMTFAETGDLAWGTAIQMTWLRPKGSQASWADPTQQDVTIDTTIDLQYWEIQLAAGPTLNLGSVWLYGGPFVYFARGDLDVQGTWNDMDANGPIEADHHIREDSNFGGFAGMQINVGDNACLYFEGQFTGEGWGRAPVGCGD